MTKIEHNLMPLSGKLYSRAIAEFSGIRADILAGGEDAPMTAMLMTVYPGQGAPAHKSHTEDKVFTIVTGRFLFLIDDERVEVGAGDSVFVGKGATHSFTAIGGVEAKLVLVATPARHDQFFQAMSELSKPHKMEEVKSVCDRFDQSIVGPVVQAIS